MAQGKRCARKEGQERRGRAVLIAVLGSTVAALVLTLGVNGTLASWTSAVIGNDTNTVATANAVILREVSGANTCLSSSGAANSFTCSTINKYGGTASPLAPGGSQQVDVVFSNVGAAAAGTFSLAAGSCSQTPTAGSGTPAAANVCTSGDLTVAVSCSNGSSYAAGSAWTDLVYAAGAPGSLGTLTHTATLAAGSSFTCRFTVALSGTASVLAQGITASQPLTWTLSV
ncbi:MAG: hypothetical protein J7518_07050 [Nocardioidaceae bacterium]|nr:hypothetical protein [Nocardioidaceae bacterium]